MKRGKDMDDIKIQLEAYRLIRQASRNGVEPLSNESLGAYVRGVVELQTELYKLNQREEGDKKGE
jgi:hypothetical protein